MAARNLPRPPPGRSLLPFDETAPLGALILDKSRLLRVDHDPRCADIDGIAETRVAVYGHGMLTAWQMSSTFSTSSSVTNPASGSRRSERWCLNPKHHELEPPFQQSYGCPTG